MYCNGTGFFGQLWDTNLCVFVVMLFNGNFLQNKICDFCILLAIHECFITATNASKEVGHVHVPIAMHGDSYTFKFIC